MDLERITKFIPAFDKRDDDPNKYYGIGAMEVLMLVKGKKGAVQFRFSTGIYTPEVTQELAENGELNWKELSPGHWFAIGKPMGYDVGYHSLEPQYEGQEVMWPTKMRKADPDMPEPGPNATQEERLAYIQNVVFDKIGEAAPNCDILGAPCYYDGSTMRAEEWLTILIREGVGKIWEMLEAEYKELFHEDD